VLDTREVVELDAEDISVGGWATGRRGLFICWNWAEGLEICCRPGRLEHGFILFQHGCGAYAAIILALDFRGDHDIGCAALTQGLPMVDGPDSLLPSLRRIAHSNPSHRQNTSRICFGTAKDLASCEESGTDHDLDLDFSPSRVLIRSKWPQYAARESFHCP
jgi:hypothetical protein